MHRASFALLLLAACSDTEVRDQQIAIGELLSSAADPGFARALEPREFAFPADHGPHPQFQTEWWYFTGNLADSAGREFGYQLTFFRRALHAGEAESASQWAVRDAYMAHFALSDVAGGRFHSFERLSRGALGLAGATGEPWRVWLEDWSAAGSLEVGGNARLVARQGEVALELDVTAAKTPVLQGANGLSRKGSDPGNASYYYSLTRLDTRGRIALGERQFEVRGTSWFDREWSTSALEPGQIGWDWFALQFDDGRELMLYRMRRADGALDPHSSGSLVDAQGGVTRLAAQDFALEVLDDWRSESSGVSYPARWRIRVPSAQLVLELTPKLADQELRHAVTYWEGAVNVERDGRAFGRGYVEMTGY